jgi:hypothetical protein
LLPRRTSCTGRIRRNRPPAKSNSGFPVDNGVVQPGPVTTSGMGYWLRIDGCTPGPDVRMKT